MSDEIAEVTGGCDEPRWVKMSDYPEWDRKFGCDFKIKCFASYIDFVVVFEIKNFWVYHTKPEMLNLGPM